MSGKGKSFQGKDFLSRMNFLYQASMLMAGKSDTLSAYYGNLCRTIGKKSVLRIEPDIKRTLCKKCGMALKPGITADVSAFGGKAEIFSIKCKKCYFRRNFPVNPEYSFWLEKPESIAAVCTLGDEEDTGTQKKKRKLCETKDEVS